MSESNEPKNKGGRPATGRRYPHKVFGYVGDEELRLLKILAEKENGGGRPRGEAGVIRAGIRALAREEGVE